MRSNLDAFILTSVVAFGYGGVIAFVQLLWLPPEWAGVSIVLGVALVAAALLFLAARRLFR